VWTAIHPFSQLYRSRKEASYQSGGEMERVQPVAVVTDSAAGIPPSLLEQYRMEKIPFWVRVGEGSYKDGVDINPTSFFRMLRADEEATVGTSVPTVEAFLEVYNRVAEWAERIVSVHVAGEQSGTCNAAQLAAEASPIPVTVIDSGTTAMAEGFIALEAARVALEGASLDAVLGRVRALLPQTGLLALLETVNYAVKGGRLTTAARLIGNLLRIQPLISVSENKVSLAGQVRRRRSGLKVLVERVIERVDGWPVRLTVHYAEDEEEGRSLLETLKARLNCLETYLTRVPVALGVHAGPGSIGVAYCIEKE
jgi:DegV family protein with EDD domain